VVTLYATSATHEYSQSVVAPYPVLPGAVGDVTPRHGLSQLWVASRRAHPLRCQKFDLRFELSHL
jgi:hypothetical protein